MAGTTSAPGTGRPVRKRQFPFGLVMLAFGLGLGFYGGIAATKRAMTSPEWVQRIFGVTPAPAPPPTVAVTTLPATQPALAGPTNPPPTPPVAAGTGDNSNQADPTAKPDKPAKHNQADSRDLVAAWEVTDSLASDGAPASSVTSTYVFRADNTGEYDSNGKKLYDFKWKPAGDDITLEYDAEGPDPNQTWSVRLAWSLNDTKSVLTLVPVTGKDARSFVYSLSPGVYHRKGLTPGGSL